MKKIDTSLISTTVGMPIKSGVLVHLMQAYQEGLQIIGQNLIGPEYDPTKVYILYGANNSGSGLTYIISSGAVFYNGEVFFLPGVSVVAAGGQVLVANIATAFATGASGDPVQFTDGSNNNVLQIRTVVPVAGLTGTGGLPDYSAWTRVNPVKTQAIINAAVGSAYTINFRQDQSVFFTTGLTSGSLTISWDFLGAVPGTVVRLKIVSAVGTSGSFATPGGATIINEAGSILSNKTNLVYAMYMGKNDAGNDEVSYKVISF